MQSKLRSVIELNLFRKPLDVFGGSFCCARVLSITSAYSGVNHNLSIPKLFSALHNQGGAFMDSIDKINLVLARRGMSGAELERLIGVSNSVYSQWNTRTTKPSNKSLVKIANALDVDVADLLPDKEKKEKPSTENGERLFSYSDLEILDAIKRADPKDLKAIRVILGIE